MELRNVTRPKSCFHYDSLFRFLNHPANRVSFGMVCDLDTDFLLLADDIVVDFCLLAMRMGLLEESDCSGSEGLPRSFPDLAKSDLCTIKSFSSCCLWTRRSWDDTDLLRLGPENLSVKCMIIVLHFQEPQSTNLYASLWFGLSDQLTSNPLDQG